ncbi:MAG: VacJ family lipoprotein [Rhodoferax sp.]|nr:VacJ family lipoprotein [Rhodoferax sp.]MCF8208414.1 VacJ family lipoprotein [Rhodoferax sp.]
MKTRTFDRAVYGSGTWPHRVATGLLLLLLGLLQACATVSKPDPRDPLESVNRSIFSFNDAVDRAVLKPVAVAYQEVAPNWVRKGVGNFFNNLEDAWSVVNNALQLRGQETGDSLARVLVNSTVGLLGLVDVASDLNLERHTANFGLTLGRWGVGPGPFVVLPLLGPSTLRDTAALPLDLRGDLVNSIDDTASRNGATVLNVVSQRARYLSAGALVEEAALDKYSFIRDAFLQRRRNLVYDGNPPEEEETVEPAQ